MPPLEQLKKKIQSAVPEIMELKFGCEVETARNGAVARWRYIGKTDFHNKEIWECLWSNFATVKWSDQIGIKRNYILIGRPIRLADVLLAIGKKSKGQFDGVGIGIDGRFFKTELEFGDTFTKAVWNLAKDSLDDQSPKTIEFLNNPLS